MRTGRSQPLRFEDGFSLVELLVVVAIMAVLATAAFPLAELSRQRAMEEELRRSLREIRDGLDAYKRLVDEGRISRPTADSSGYPPTLEALVAGVTDAKSPSRAKIFLLRRLPRDPMAAPEEAAEATWALRSYVSPPDDPQPGTDVYDVHSRSKAIGLNGVPYRLW